jgi:hypothetical protein
MENAPTFESLPFLDVRGQPLSVGCNVQVLSVDSCCTGLPLEEQDRLRRIVGQTRRIIEFDKWGFVWLSFDAESTSSSDFSLFPKELMLI